MYLMSQLCVNRSTCIKPKSLSFSIQFQALHHTGIDNVDRTLCRDNMYCDRTYVHSSAVDFLGDSLTSVKNFMYVHTRVINGGTFDSYHG